MLIWNKEELPHQWKESIVPIHKKGDETDCSNYRGISLLSTSYKILSNIFLSKLIPYADEIIGNTNAAFDVIGQRLIRFSMFRIVFWDVQPCKILHGSTSQKTILNIILAAVRT
jgi:hypothetical protein